MGFELSEEMVAALAQSAGTVELQLDFGSPPRRPEPGYARLVNVVAGRTVNRLELDTLGTLRFVRGNGNGNGKALSASVPVRPLLEHPRWWVALVFSPERVELHVGDADRKLGLVSGHSRPVPPRRPRTHS